MPLSKLNLPLKIQGGTLYLVTQYFFLLQYILSANKHILNGYWIRCLKIIVSKYLAPEEGGREGFHIRFLCKRSKQYVEFGI